MKAFHGDPAFKERFLNELKWHRDQDRLIQHTYGRIIDGKWKGCAVACSWRSLHGLREDVDGSFDSDELPLASGLGLGLPQALLLSLEHLFEEPTDAFEGSPADWTIAFFEAIPVGAEYNEDEAERLAASVYQCEDTEDEVLAFLSEPVRP